MPARGWSSWRVRCAPPGCGRATASPRGCRTSSRRRSRCSPPYRSAPVFSSTSPDFGIDGVLDRFGQIEPVVLFAADGYSYGGKSLDCLERLATIRAALPTVRQVVVVPHRAGLGGRREHRRPVGHCRRLCRGTTSPPRRSAMSARSSSSSSRSTTRGTCCSARAPRACRSASCTRTGGVLLQHLKEQQLHCDVRPGDRVAYYTTCGWMMWNWLASIPASGATGGALRRFAVPPGRRGDDPRSSTASTSPSTAPRRSTSIRCARTASCRATMRRCRRFVPSPRRARHYRPRPTGGRP